MGKLGAIGNVTAFKRRQRSVVLMKNGLPLTLWRQWAPAAQIHKHIIQAIRQPLVLAPLTPRTQLVYHACKGTIVRTALDGRTAYSYGTLVTLSLGKWEDVEEA